MTRDNRKEDFGTCKQRGAVSNRTDEGQRLETNPAIPQRHNTLIGNKLCHSVRYGRFDQSPEAAADRIIK